MPRVLQALVRRLVRWGVLPAAKAPDSAIINIYEPEDCIPPHIDHHDFTRPLLHAQARRGTAGCAKRARCSASHIHGCWMEPVTRCTACCDPVMRW